MSNFKKPKTTLIRLPVSLINEIRMKLPSAESDGERFKSLYDMSLLKHSETVDKMGRFIYGNTWKKIK